MDIFRDLGVWLFAVGWWWILLMSGWIGLGVGLWERMRGDTSAKSVAFIVGGGLAIMIACFATWRAQYQAAQKARADLTMLTVPKLSGEVTLWSAAPTTNPIGTLVAIVVRIQNEGAPTIIRNVSAAVIRDQPHRVFPGQIIPDVGPITLPIPDSDGAAYVLTPDKRLMARAEETPIPTNGAVEGFIAVFAGRVKREEMFPGGWPEISFDDIRGRHYTIKGNPAGSGSKPVLNPYTLQQELTDQQPKPTQPE